MVLLPTALVTEITGNHIYMHDETARVSFLSGKQHKPQLNNGFIRCLLFAAERNKRVHSIAFLEGGDNLGGRGKETINKIVTDIKVLKTVTPTVRR